MYSIREMMGSPYQVWVTRNGKWRCVHATGNLQYCQGLVSRWGAAYPGERAEIRTV